MEVDIQTFRLFIDYKCGLISMDGKEKQVYDTLKGDVLFFYPTRNKMTLNEITGRNKEFNLPIVCTEVNKQEWTVNNNQELETILKTL